MSSKLKANALVYHNTQSLNSPVKHWKALNYYHSVGADVVFLQEFHFPSFYAPPFLHNQYSHFFLANAPNKTLCMIIVISKRLSFSPSTVVKDPQGRYLLVAWEIEVTFVMY